MDAMHTAFEAQRGAMIARAAARMAVGFDATCLRSVFVSWKTLVKETRAGEQQKQAVEKLTAKMMLLADSDASILHAYFSAFRDVMLKSKQRKKHLSKFESFALSAAQAMVELWWNKWVEAVGAAKRGRREAAQQAVSKRNLMRFVESGGDATMLLRACFQALREELAVRRRAKLAGEMEKLQGMHDAIEARQRALVTKAASKMALAFDSTAA